MSTTFVHNGTVPPQGLKDADDVVWFGVAWDDEIKAGDSIRNSEWLTPVGGLVIANQYQAQTATVNGKSYSHVNTVLLSGGAVGRIYTVTNRVTLTDGQTFDRSFKIKVVDR